MLTISMQSQYQPTPSLRSLPSPELATCSLTAVRRHYLLRGRAASPHRAAAVVDFRIIFSEFDMRGCEQRVTGNIRRFPCLQIWLTSLPRLLNHEVLRLFLASTVVGTFGSLLMSECSNNVAPIKRSYVMQHCRSLFLLLFMLPRTYLTMLLCILRYHS